MEAEFIYKKLYPQQPFKDVLEVFFSEYSPQTTHFLFLKIFQCWGINKCTLKSEISDEEIALFFDQLIDLVAAAHIEHQANRVSHNKQHGGDDE